MGRNNVPKFGEWQDGWLYEFKVVGSTKDEKCPFSAESGCMIIYQRTKSTYHEKQEEILSCFYADGFFECVASAFQSGYNKGVKVGRQEKIKEFRDALDKE